MWNIEVLASTKCSVEREGLCWRLGTILDGGDLYSGTLTHPTKTHELPDADVRDS